MTVKLNLKKSKLTNNLVAIFSGKGGVGKTTILLNLAGVLSNQNKKILILDLDLFSGGVALCLNKSSEKTIYDFHKNKNEISQYINKYNDNIDFISSPKSIEEAKKVNFETIEKLIYEINLHYDFILIDLSHFYNDLNSKILNLVDNVLYVLTNDSMDLKNSFNMITKLKRNNNEINVILNYSIHPDRDYYSLFDIKNIINENVDFTISSSFYNPNIDFLTVRGQIQSLNSKKFYDYKILQLVAKSFTEK